MMRFPIFPLQVAEISGLADGSMLTISIGWVYDPRSKSLAVAALPKEIVGIQNDEQRFSLLLKLGYATPNEYLKGGVKATLVAKRIGAGLKSHVLWESQGFVRM